MCHKVIFEINLQGCAGSAAQSLLLLPFYVWLDGELGIGVMKVEVCGWWRDLWVGETHPRGASETRGPRGAQGRGRDRLSGPQRGFLPCCPPSTPPLQLPPQSLVPASMPNLLAGESESIKFSLRAGGQRWGLPAWEERPCSGHRRNTLTLGHLASRILLVLPQPPGAPMKVWICLGLSV